MRAATLRNYNTSDQGPYDRNFLVHINNENFLEALPNEILAKRKRSILHVYVKPCEIRNVILLAKLLQAIAESSSSKKTSHFPH